MVFVVGAADTSAAWLAQPDAFGGALADGALDGVGAQGEGWIERRVEDSGYGGLGAGLAEPAVSFAVGHLGRRLDGTVLLRCQLLLSPYIGA